MILRSDEASEHVICTIDISNGSLDKIRSRILLFRVGELTN